MDVTPITRRQFDAYDALLTVYERDGRATVRALADELGVVVSVAYAHLHSLRRAGLATWDPEHAGTLRPLVSLVAQEAT